MKTILVALFSFFLSGIVYGQKEKNFWYFGDKAGIDFLSGTPVAVTDGSMHTLEGCATISDRTTGQLLFYTNGVNVWNRLHAVMPNGAGLFGDTSSTQSALIVPFPNDSTRYYLFTSDQGGYFGPTRGVRYSVVDMSRNAGLGDVTVKNILLLIPATEKLVAVPHCNGRETWVIAHQWMSNKFYTWLVTAQGISDTVISSVGEVHTGDTSNPSGYNHTIGYLKASTDGARLALVIYYTGVIEIFDFDNVTGIISHPIRLAGDWGEYGVSFSPDNTRLYTSSERGYLIQYNLAAGNGNRDSILNSRTAVYMCDSLEKPLPTALQLGFDGKIYVGMQHAPFLGIIRNPNKVGADCDFVWKGLDLSGRLCLSGLPNFMDAVGRNESSCFSCGLFTISSRHVDGDNCCTEFTLLNRFKEGVIFGLEANLLSPGVTIRSASGPWTPQPATTPTSVSWSVPPPGLPLGRRDSLVVCFNNAPDSSIRLALKWRDVSGTTICYDTLTVACSTVGINNERSTPGSDLLEIYPDPTSSQTTIAFSMRKKENVSVVITDVLGREIMQLLDHVMLDEGLHRFEFNASSLRGGIYFCVVRTSSIITTKALRVMR